MASISIDKCLPFTQIHQARMEFGSNYGFVRFNLAKWHIYKNNKCIYDVTLL